MLTQDEKWLAVVEGDRERDGSFFYGVKTTGVFCRPSCKSRTPQRGNVTFFDTAAQAVQAGFRPCKRCRPDLFDYRPLEDTAAEARRLIERNAGQRQLLSAELANLGLSRRRLDQVFRGAYGLSIADYADRYRLRGAKAQLSDTNVPLLNIALALGFESASAFSSFFRRHTGCTPREYRLQRMKRTDGDMAFGWVYQTAMGPLAVTAGQSAVSSVQFGTALKEGVAQQRTELLDRAALELEEYFAGTRRHFSVPYDAPGTPFQREVWQAICAIPYGQTRTYLEVARAIGRPGASRAVGMACNRNPLLLLIPCHRIVGSGGKLVGYAGGMDMKRQLLNIERADRDRDM